MYEDETRGAEAPNARGIRHGPGGCGENPAGRIQSAPAVRETISPPVRAAGVVVPDESRVRRVQAKIDGWVEKLHSNFTGQLVTKGQPLLEITPRSSWRRSGNTCWPGRAWSG